MPYPLLAAHLDQMPRLLAAETLRAYEPAVVASNVGIKIDDAKKAIAAWQKAARPRRRHTAPVSREQRLAAIEAMGIPVEYEDDPDGV